MIELVISIKLFVQMDIITLALILYVNSEELELFKNGDNKKCPGKKSIKPFKVRLLRLWRVNCKC